MVDARSEEIVCGGVGKHHGRTPRKQLLLEPNWEVFVPDITPEVSVHGGSGHSSGTTNEDTQETAKLRV